MRRQFTLRALFGVTTLVCGLGAAMATQHPYAMFPLAIAVLALIALWPWMFGHGG